MTVGGSARPDARAAGERHVVEWLRGTWGLALWILFNAAVAVLAAAQPARTATGTHAAAALDWWAGRPIALFPPSAVLFSPLAFLPLAVADQLWRLLSVVILTWAVHRAAALVRPDAPGRIAQYVLVLAIPTAAVGMLRGAFELMMFAVLLHATVDLAWGRWTRGGLLLALAAALEPAALAPALLFGVLRPRATPWLLSGLAVVFAVPFLHADPGYVAGRYAAAASTLGTPVDTRGFDVTALLEHVGLAPAYAVMTGVRVLAALCTLGAAFVAYRRLDGRTATLVTLMLAVTSLLLFDPRTGEGAFVAAAVPAALALFAEHQRRPAAALPVLLGALVVALGTHFYGGWIDRPAQGWAKPALTLLLYVYVATVVVRRRTLIDPDPEPARRTGWRPDRVAFVLCAAALPVYAGTQLLAQAPLRRWLSAFEVVDYLILVVALNLIGVALVVHRPAVDLDARPAGPADAGRVTYSTVTTANGRS